MASTGEAPTSVETQARPVVSDADAWWRNAVVYQIYPRSFADSNGDGIGDLVGIRDHLDHLAWLGVDALWLSPIYPSPMWDFGYDVADYCDVDPIFGSLDDVDALVAAAHERGLRVLLDWVPNHTSIDHPWFRDACAGRNSEHRDWYVWKDPSADGGPPNNWRRMWSTEPAWTYHEPTAQWFLHCYFPQQPDLNWHNPLVEAAMHDTLRFWLDRGIDGFRADVVHLIGKDPATPDLPEALVETPISRQVSGAYGHDLLRRVRQLLDDSPRRPVMVGEVVLFEPGQTASYLGDGDELHQVFDFRMIKSPWEAAAFRSRISEIHQEIGARYWPTWVLGNHDNPRQRTRFGDDRRARAAAVLTLTLRGSAYLYQGEELGLPDAQVPREAWQDPAGRDGCRAPMPWTRRAGHGWDSGSWLPHVADAPTLSVESQRTDPTSTLWLYRHLLELRQRSTALSDGSEELIDTPDGVVGWSRTAPDERVDVFVNFDDATRRIDVNGRVLLSSDPHRHPEVSKGADFDGLLRPDEAIVIRR